MATRPDPVPDDQARRERLRRLTKLTPAERVERLDQLNRQLYAVREAARGSRPGS